MNSKLSIAALFTLVLALGPNSGYASGVTFSVKKEELGSGEKMELKIPVPDRRAALFVVCKSDGWMYTSLVVNLITFFPSDTNFDNGTMDVDVLYKFDTDSDATWSKWKATLGKYDHVYVTDRSVVERIGSASRLVMSVGKTNERFRVPLTGTRKHIDRILEACS